MLDQKVHSRFEGVRHAGGVVLLLVYSKSIGASWDRSVRRCIMMIRDQSRVCSGIKSVCGRKGEAVGRNGQGKTSGGGRREKGCRGSSPTKRANAYIT